MSARFIAVREQIEKLTSTAASRVEAEVRPFITTRSRYAVSVDEQRSFPHGTCTLHLSCGDLPVDVNTQINYLALLTTNVHVNITHKLRYI